MDIQLLRDGEFTRNFWDKLSHLPCSSIYNQARRSSQIPFGSFFPLLTAVQTSICYPLFSGPFVVLFCRYLYLFENTWHQSSLPVVSLRLLTLEEVTETFTVILKLPTIRGTTCPSTGPNEHGWKLRPLCYGRSGHLAAFTFVVAATVRYGRYGAAMEWDRFVFSKKF